jgi:RNA polymerase sigma factor (sigma-70 family)
MESPSQPVADELSILEQISTHWPLITDPLQFVLRYAPAARSYLRALVKDPHDAEDVTQSFLLRMVHRPITPEQVPNGRFRDYLKAVLRNAALTHYRRASRHAKSSKKLETVPAVAESQADGAWLAQWRHCLLQRVWDRLEQHEHQAPEGLAYTVLRLAADHEGEDSTALARRASSRAGRQIRADAFRKQLSRARRRFAELLFKEVQQTLQRPSNTAVVQELRELGLMQYVRDYLPTSLRETASSAP